MPEHDDHRHTEEFLRLLGEHEERTKAFIFSVVPHWADAEDISQEVRLRLWDQFESYDRSKDFGAWSRTIAHFMVLAFRKQLRLKHVNLSPEFLSAVAKEFDSSSMDLEARNRALESCLGKMSGTKRELLFRCYSSKEGLRQIADRIGQSFETLRKSIFRMRSAPAECVEKTLAKETGK